MSDTATELPVDQTPAPEPTPAVDETPVVEAVPLNIDDDAAVDAALESATITIPGDDGLVPMSEAGRVGRAYREKIKELKGELATANTTAAEAATLKQHIAQLQAQLQQAQPYVSAYEAMTQAAQQVAPNPQEDAAAEDYARLLDLYTTDGKPDIERGKKGLAIQRRLASEAAQQSVAPLQQQSVAQQSAYNLARAKNTVLPNGMKADPALIESVWQRIGPELTATPEGAKNALVIAAGYTMLSAPPTPQQAPAARTPTGQFTGQQPPPPMFIEKAGGKVTADDPLSEKDRAYIKAAGITEKDFLDSARNAPWLRK